ncbi:MAG TPA: hypothetical protein VFF04_01230 [Candidatus Babeliales bacterium]|nr:hypothetical protein [Candidatus Babeliales bacterium]
MIKQSESIYNIILFSSDEKIPKWQRSVIYCEEDDALYVPHVFVSPKDMHWAQADNAPMIEYRGKVYLDIDWVINYLDQIDEYEDAAGLFIFSQRIKKAVQSEKSITHAEA